MPYTNVPKSLWGKMDDCVKKVMAQGHDKPSAIAICHTSLVKEIAEEDSMSRQDRAKARANRRAKESAVIKDLALLATAYVDEAESQDKAAYPWEQCIRDQMKRYGSRKRAEKVCGAIRAGVVGKELDDLVQLETITAPQFRASKAITDAPNLRADAEQECGNCAHFTPLPADPDMPADMCESGICDLYEFEADKDWVCDSWAEVAQPDPGEAMQQAADAMSQMADAMPQMDMGGKERPTHDHAHAHGDKTHAHPHNHTDVHWEANANAPHEHAHTQAQMDAMQPVKKQAPLTPRSERCVAVFKQADGRLRVFGWASNHYRDHDRPQQIITEAAHKEFEQYLDAHPDKAPEFWHWHTPGSRYAKADWWHYADGFMLYSGLVDAGKEPEAEAVTKQGNVGMSHGFLVLGYDKDHDHITQYRTFEVSDLPLSRAANPWTGFQTIRKEASMAFSEEKRKYLLSIGMSDEQVKTLEAQTADRKAAVDTLGVESKETEPAEPVVVVPEAEPEAETPEAPATLAAIQQVLAPLVKQVESLTPLVERVQTLGEQVTALQTQVKETRETAEAAKASLDAEVAALIAPSIDPRGRGKRPTQSNKNTVTEPVTKELQPVMRTAEFVAGLAESIGGLK